ncbi:MAG: DNA primase [Gammaproteobacteria bacterium]|nr:MAG: DNA primase [Gammaproteobacteria bacterium]
MSGLIPQHFIDDLIARADIIEVIGKRVQLKKAGREFKANCPFHDEKTPSFTVSPAKGFYHCFGCGAHGTALGFLMEYDHMSFVEAVESLASSMGIEVPRDESQRPAHRYDELFELLAKVERYYQANLRNNDAAKDYLKARGIDSATAKRFSIGYASAGWSTVLDKFGKSNEIIERLLAVGLVIRKDNASHYDRFRDRIMFPIRDARGRCIGFGGRVIGDQEPKYLNSPETVLFHKGRELYGLYEARQAIRNIEMLVVVEGYMDVVGLARHGIEFAVATLGTATSDDHLTRLFRLTEEVIFCFDGDSAGRAAAWRALEATLPQIREGRQIRFVFLPEGQDPDSFIRDNGAKAFEGALAEGVPLSDFLVRELALKVDMDSVDGRARLAELAKPLVQRIPQGVYRELLTERLAEAVGLSASKLHALFSKDQETGRGQRYARGIAGIRSARSQRQSGVSKPSVVRRAITLLLNNPEAGQALDVEKLAGVTRPGTDLLRELIETVQADPSLTTAGILERWRNREEGRHLGKLAAVEIPDDEDFDASAELEHSLDQLAAYRQRERMDNLVKKEGLSSLSEAERTELREHRRGPEMSG